MKMLSKVATILSCFLACLSTNASPLNITKLVESPELDAESQPRVPQLDGRIVGGTEVLITRFPWQLSLLRENGEYDDYHTCGAVIISEKFALTAAHCIYGVEVTELRLRAGSTKYYSGGIVYPVTRGYIHQSFNKATMDYDVAILKVKPNFAIGSTLIKTVHLPEAGYAPKIGSLLYVSGWGVLYSGSAQISNNLRAVEVPVVSTFDCKEAYGADLITKRMLCAGYTEGGKDACQGDSGGPLVEGSTLVGIVSWGQGCALANKPGVYADIGNLRTWIHYITGI